MRFHITNQYSALRSQWDDAFARLETFAEAGDDGVALGGTAASDEASAAEYLALDACLDHSAVTPIELQDQIAVMRARGPLAPDALIWAEAPMKAWLDRIERDLVEMARPATCGLVGEAFASWADAFQAGIEEDAQAARSRLLALPCISPGDFIAKAFVSLMHRVGPEPMSPSTIFMPNEALMTDEDRQVWRDILDCDLGCCMVALGRTQFSASRWVLAARRASKRFGLSHADGRWAFWTSLDSGKVDNILQRLTANGLRMVSSDRCAAIANLIDGFIEAVPVTVVEPQPEMQA